MTRRGYPEVFVRIARLIPEEFREQYWRFLAYCQSLPPDDDITLLLEATGYHILLIQMIPEELAKERESIRTMMNAVHLKLADANAELAKRLSEFLTALEASFQKNQARQEEVLAAIAKALQEIASIRQNHDRELHALWDKIRPWAMAHLLAPVIMLGIGFGLGYWLCIVGHHAG